MFCMSAVVEVCVCHLFPKLALAKEFLTVLVKGALIIKKCNDFCGLCTFRFSLSPKVAFVIDFQYFAHI